MSPEIQYFYFRSAIEPIPWDPISHLDHALAEAASDLRKETILALQGVGVSVQCSHYEVAPSQQEIDLPPADALTTADNVVTFRHVVKEMARARGAYASFMPKPLAGRHGSGMHTKLSLLDGDVNAFHDPGDRYGLSTVAKGFMAGLLRHAPEITAVTNQWVNSYKRLVVGYDAPVFISWDNHDRSALVRVPPSGGGWIEYRSPDPACNPYLALSVILAAGMRGIEDGYELPPETTANVVEMNPEERITEGILALPESLSEALEALERSGLVADALGKDLFEHFIDKKCQEWDEYKRWVLRTGERLLGPRDGVVTAFETERYLGLL